MNVLVLRDNKLLKYDVKYDEVEMNNFLRGVINDYGFFRNLELKLDSEDKISFYCDEYRDLKITIPHEDNSMIHKGRKRIQRKPQKIKNIYNITAVDYPEVFFTIIRFLKQDKLDFGVFSKYLKPVLTAVNFNYFKEEGYMNYRANAAESFKSLINSYELREKYKEDVICRRLIQSRCLREFYSLLAFTNIENVEYIDFQFPDLLLSLYNELNSFSNLLSNVNYLEVTNESIKQCLNPLITPDEVKSARINNNIIERVESFSHPKVKTR